jgi:hypothetical protein
VLGTQTAALAFGGILVQLKQEQQKNIMEQVGQHSPGSLNTARESTTGAGTQTAALAFGGLTTVATGATEEYNGTSWTSSNSLNTARYNLGGAGTQTAGLGFGGEIPGSPAQTAATEEYDGTSWTSHQIL